jgi:riboflavin biosynthesis pyrimidine reductase
MEPLKTYIDQKEMDDVLTEEIGHLYGGKLSFPSAPESRPYVVINFVATMEGITSFNLPNHIGGGDISGFNVHDVFILGILRSLADAVAVGANAVRLNKKHLWTPEFISPEHSEMFQKLRQTIGKDRINPLNAFVTGSGKILPEDPKDPLPEVFGSNEIETMIITTKGGQEVVNREFAQRNLKPSVIVAGDDREVDLSKALSRLRCEYNVSLLLVEGGATFSGSIIKNKLYDEVFLTVAPQVVGTLKTNPRPLFVEGFENAPETSIWHQLIGLKVYGDYIYKRYRRK